MRAWHDVPWGSDLREHFHAIIEIRDPLSLELRVQSERAEKGLRVSRRFVRCPAGAVALAATLVLGSCAPNGSKNVTSKPISEVLQAHTPELMAIPGVIGTGEGELRGERTVLVLVTRRTPEIDARVPKRLEGYPVDIRVVGEVRKLHGR